MKYRELGRTGMTVSEVTMGCWAIAGGLFWGEQSEADSIATVRAALDAGVNCFDTAERYGSGLSEEILGKALEGRRLEAVIASKADSSHLDPKRLAAACNASLRRLRTDYIDLYQIHWPNRSVPLSQTLGAMAKLREEGKIRAIGVSNFGPQDLAEAIAIAPIASDQVPYNLLWRPVEYDIQKACVENAVSILCYSPLAQGLLTGKFYSSADVPLSRRANRLFLRAQARKAAFASLDRIRAVADRLGQPMARVALAWLLRQPGVTAVIAGARQPGQIEANAAASDLDLPDEVAMELADATADLKAIIGRNPDLWAPGRLSHYR